jgi:hypothetical protein
MNNMDNGNGAGDWPTAPYSGPAPPAGGPGRNGGKRTWSRGKRAAALLGICAVAAGGAFVVTEVGTGSPATAPAAGTTGFQAGTSASVTGQAATLSNALSGTGAGRLARLRRLGGLYGQYTYETKTGPDTLAFERGTITSVGSGDVTVRAANGTSWTWELISTSVVRENGNKVAESTLATGDTVFAGGPVTNGARDARLIVIRKAAAASSAGPASSGTA